MNKIIKITVLVLWLITCKEAAVIKSKIIKEKFPLSYVVTFALGKPTVNGKPIRSGDILTGETKLLVPVNSQLDIQIKGLQSSVQLRIKSGTELNLYARKSPELTEFITYLKKGDVLYAISKLTKGEAILALTPVSHNEVRGTQFKVTVKEDGTSSLKVAEGSVATSYSNPAIEALSDSDKVKEKGQAEINNLLSNPTVVEAGKEVTVTKKDLDNALEDPELKALLDSPSLKKLDDPTTLPKDSELEIHLAEYEKKYAATQQENSTVAAQKTNATIQIAENKDTDAIKKESSEIVAIILDEKKNAADIKKLVEANIRSKSAELNKTVEKVFGKAAETLNLTDGTKIKGVIMQQNGNYIVQTPEGEKQFTDAEVQGFNF